MSKFMAAMSTNDTRTENGMLTHSTSDSALVDMFYRMGASRVLTDENILRSFVSAFGEDSLLTLKAMFYNRDIRGGQGERRSFRIMFRYLCANYPEIAIKNINNVIKYGRWDDLFVAFGTKAETAVLEKIKLALKETDTLCAKWLPRENKKYGFIATKIRHYLGLNAKQYRKMLSDMTRVVETSMCSNKWDAIKYSHVPSKAMNIYRKAFLRHDPTGFESWITALETGEEKVNAGALYPYEIVSKLSELSGYMYLKNTQSVGDKVLEAQWKALPNFIPAGRKIFPMIDVSGSMTAPISRKSRVTCMDVAISLGLYISERNESIFKNSFLTFSGIPEFYTLKGKTLLDRIIEMRSSKWGFNTDIMKAFHTVLSRARAANLIQDDMPEYILIISDMQFDQACPSMNGFVQMKEEYKKFGYEMPKIIFWNVRTTEDKQSPVKKDERDTALVSGFSPSIMKSVLTGEFMTPEQVMLDTLNQDRYDSVVI